MPSSAKNGLGISVVLAVRDGEETVGREVRRIADHLHSRGVAFEIIAVDDGSRDNSVAVLRLLAAHMPELRLSASNARSSAFVRGAAEASGEIVLMAEAGRGGLPLAALGWALARLDAGRDAVVFRGRCIVARRLAALPAVLRASGRGYLYERTFERAAGQRRVEVVGLRPQPRGGLLQPVLRFLAA
jgi:glycosyltransferase involved in cell wall biosynthesis